MSKLKLTSKTIDLGKVKMGQLAPFIVDVEDGTIEGILSGCACTRTALAEDGKKITGTIDITQAVGAKFGGGPASRSFHITDADDATPMYVVNDQGNYHINPEKELMAVTVKFFVDQPVPTDAE